MKFWYNQWIRKDNSRWDSQRRSNLTKLSDLVILQICILKKCALVSHKLLSKVTPRFRADAEGEITLPTKDWVMKTESYFVALRVANYQEFSLWWIALKGHCEREPGAKLVKKFVRKARRDCHETDWSKIEMYGMRGCQSALHLVQPSHELALFHWW